MHGETLKLENFVV